MMVMGYSSCCCAFSGSKVLALCLVCLVVFAFSKGDDCRQIQFRDRIENKVLRNSVIRGYHVTNEEMCRIKCYMEPNCVSYNYGQMNDGSFLCELSDKSHLQVLSNELEAKDGFIYSTIFKNPCLSSPCPRNSTCQAGFGDQGYRCICPRGYHGNNCHLDIKECLEGKHNCSSTASCVDVPGSFKCTCKSGYTGNGEDCTDVDECSTPGANNCSSNADCVNELGSFDCNCKPGYTGDGVVCNDVDECNTPGANGCSSNAECINEPGSFKCNCIHGYTGDGVNCNDVDECNTPGANNCSLKGTCVNKPGAFKCSCRPGYSGDGVTCCDIDECATPGANNCSVNADCLNEPGLFECHCRPGYIGDGVRCNDVDECSISGANNCSSKADCVNEPGSFNCNCRHGYTGDGVNCSDVNECVENTHNCHSDATCTNTDGDFRCKCKTGFMGNGISCISCIIGPSGSCYKLFTQPLAWSNAKESCQALGAALVKIDSSVENDFISNNFLTYSPATKYWIGLNDLRNEGQFEWSDESSLSGYTNWLGSNPNNWGGSEDCVSIAWGVHYWGLVDFRNPQWNDENCATRNGYMCEKSA